MEPSSIWRTRTGTIVTIKRTTNTIINMNSHEGKFKMIDFDYLFLLFFELQLYSHENDESIWTKGRTLQFLFYF